MVNKNNFPAPGTVLWGFDVSLSIDTFRGGAATKPNVEFLRYVDLEIEDTVGRIPDDMLEQFVVKPGQGISLFLERMIPKGQVLMDAAQWKALDKKKRGSTQWWGIDQGHPIPSGLSLLYDGQPPGHCTLTVTRTMTVSAFLLLVGSVPFSPRQLDLYGPLA